MLFAFTFGVDEDVIKIQYHENVKFLCHDLINVALKYNQYVGQCKKHDLILKITIAGPEGRLPFVVFSDPHLLVGIGQIEQNEALSPNYSIQWFFD